MELKFLVVMGCTGVCEPKGGLGSGPKTAEASTYWCRQMGWLVETDTICGPQGKMEAQI